MQLYVVTVQGRFVDVFDDEESAKALKHSLYMGGADGIVIIPKTVEPK